MTYSPMVSSGIAGLTAALQLSPDSRYKIVMVPRHTPGVYDIEYTSLWVGAKYMPMNKQSPISHSICHTNKRHESDVKDVWDLTVYS